jgi:hypothetical protein
LTDIDPSTGPLSSSPTGLLHISTNYFNGIEMTSSASSTATGVGGGSVVDVSASLTKSAGNLSLRQRGVMETTVSSGVPGTTAVHSQPLVMGATADLGVQMIKPSFAILNQHDGEEEEDLDDDPDADLDL